MCRAVVSILLGFVVAPLVAQEASLRLEDRLVAVVDDDPILLSDVERVIALGLAPAREGESSEALRRRVLDGLIEQRLRYHEVDRYGFGGVPGRRVDEQLAVITARFSSPEALASRLAELGMDEAALRRLVTRQLEVLTYVEELLGARVFVDLEEIQRYYEDELVPELERRRQAVPAAGEVREEIRELLRQRRLNEELEEWTSELRQAADVVIYWEPPPRPLPPLVEALESEEGGESRGTAEH